VTKIIPLIAVNLITPKAFVQKTSPGNMFLASYLRL
jgi:hypothetical protein